MHVQRSWFELLVATIHGRVARDVIPMFLHYISSAEKNSLEINCQHWDRKINRRD